MVRKSLGIAVILGIVAACGFGLKVHAADILTGRTGYSPIATP